MRRPAPGSRDRIALQGGTFRAAVYDLPQRLARLAVSAHRTEETGVPRTSRNCPGTPRRARNLSESPRSRLARVWIPAPRARARPSLQATTTDGDRPLRRGAPAPPELPRSRARGTRLLYTRNGRPHWQNTVLALHPCPAAQKTMEHWHTLDAEHDEGIGLQMPAHAAASGLAGSTRQKEPDGQGVAGHGLDAASAASAEPSTLDPASAVDVGVLEHANSHAESPSTRCDSFALTSIRRDPSAVPLASLPASATATAAVHCSGGLSGADEVAFRRA